MGLLDYEKPKVQGGLLGGRPIDTTRPMLDNADGTFSTERTITIEAGGRHYVIPTIVRGTVLPQEAAILMWRGGMNPHVGEFDSAKEADEYARHRSSDIGVVRGRN